MAAQIVRLLHLLLIILPVVGIWPLQSIVNRPVDSDSFPESTVNFTLYEDNNYRCCATGCGTCQQFSMGVDRCMNFNFYRERVSSIDTHGGCLRVYETGDCSGTSLTLYPDSPCDHHYLGTCPMDGRPDGENWDNRMRSVSGCFYMRRYTPTNATCPIGTWVREVRVLRGYEYSLELDCYGPGSSNKTATVLAAKGVGMGRDAVTSCKDEPMRGLGFRIEERVVLGYCNYEEHALHPHGSLCSEPKPAVCGVAVYEYSGIFAGGHPICCLLESPVTDVQELAPDVRDGWLLLLLFPGLLVALIVAATAYTICRRRQRKFLDRLPKPEKYTFEVGDADRRRTRDGRERAQFFRYQKREYEIPLKSIVYGEKVGDGNFSEVFMGTVDVNGLKKDVAIKKCRSHRHLRIEDSGRILLTEVKLLQYIHFEKKHENVVALLHVVTDTTVPLLILEYCANGSMDNFLEETVRLKFVSQVVNDRIDLQMKQTLLPEVGVDGGRSFYYTHDLVTWIRHAASGMSYLHQEKNIIHGDLFTKNVLISKDYVAKIGDFGISKRVLSGENGKRYARVMPGDFKLPYEIKHLLPPETNLDRSKLTKELDAWTFGTVMWEILSLGAPSLHNCKHSAAQLPRPEHTTSELDALMRQCWQLDPTRRISFEGPGGLVQRLEQMNGNRGALVVNEGHVLIKSCSESGGLNGRPADTLSGTIKHFSSQGHLQFLNNAHVVDRLLQPQNLDVG